MKAATKPAPAKGAAQKGKATTSQKPAKEEKVKPQSPYTADKSGNYPFVAYSVKFRQYVEFATKPKPKLTINVRNANMVTGMDKEGNNLASIVKAAVAQNWLERGLITE